MSNFTHTTTTKTTEKKPAFVFDEGGPVHPCTYGNIHDGISLRDYFAGHALMAVYQTVYDAKEIAEASYAIADAMLEARTKQDNE